MLSYSLLLCSSYFSTSRSCLRIYALYYIYSMSFPPIFDFPEDSTFGDDVIFTDIHIDPASLPAPAPEATTVVDNSTDEEEEDPAEEEDESSDEPDDNMSEDEPEEAIPSFYTPGGGRPRTMLTARKSVRFPNTDYASSSRAHGPHNIRIPSPTPSPIPSPAPSSPITSRFIFSPSTTPLSVPPSPAVEPQPPSPRFPGNIPETTTPVQLPPSTSPHLRSAEWIEYWQNFQPTRGASTSSAPLPQAHEDPTVSQLIGHASDFDLRIMHLEDSMEVLAGPAQIEDLAIQVQDLEERVHLVEHRAFQMNDRVLARGALADQVQSVLTRLQTWETERDFLRSRVRDLEQKIFGIHRAPRYISIFLLY